MNKTYWESSISDYYNNWHTEPNPLQNREQCLSLSHHKIAKQDAHKAYVNQQMELIKTDAEAHRERFKQQQSDALNKYKK